jgi:hypothetical protein
MFRLSHPSSGVQVVMMKQSALFCIVVLQIVRGNYIRKAEQHYTRAAESFITTTYTPDDG